MKKGNSSIALATLFALSLALPAIAAQQPSTETPVVTHTKRVTISATVVDIDKEGRTLTLQGKDGNQRQVKVGPNVRNFDQIKVGDTVTAQYYQSAAISLRKQAPGEPAMAEAPPVVRVAPLGGKPSGAVAKTVVASALVEDINHATREVTLKGPRGNSFTLLVDKQVPNLDQVQKGDHVVVTYSEALAVNVTPKG